MIFFTMSHHGLGDAPVTHQVFFFVAHFGPPKKNTSMTVFPDDTSPWTLLEPQVCNRPGLAFPKALAKESFEN